MHPITLEQAEKFKADHPTMFARKEYGDLILFDYHYKDPQVMGYDSPARDMRGIIFDTSGEIASLPLRTFYNTHEIPDRVPTYNGYYSEKQDGSMLQVSFHQGRLITASRSSMDGYVARSVTITPALENYVRSYPEYTFIFEFLDPNHPIVIVPEKEELVFLVARHKVTGMYSHDFSPPETRVNEIRPLTGDMWPELCARLNEEKTEGVVIWSDGDFWKYKTSWYVDLHGMATNLRPEYVVYAWCRGEYDDLSSTLRQYGREDLLSTSQVIIEEFSRKLNYKATEMVDFARQQSTPKEVALGLTRSTHLDKVVFGAVMDAFRKELLEDTGYVLSKVKSNLIPVRIREIMNDNH